MNEHMCGLFLTFASGAPADRTPRCTLPLGMEEHIELIKEQPSTEYVPCLRVVQKAQLNTNNAARSSLL